MDIVTGLVAPVLVLVVGYLVRLAAKALKVELDEKTFNAIVGSIVAYLIALAFGNPVRALLGG